MHKILTRPIVLKRDDPHCYNLHVPAPDSPVQKEGEPCLYTVPGLGGEILMPKILEKISRVDGDSSSGSGEDGEYAPNGSNWKGYAELDEVDWNEYDNEDDMPELEEREADDDSSDGGDYEPDEYDDDEESMGTEL